MALRKPVPPGECPQCWRHAYDPDIHRRQDQSKDCLQCVDHLVNGCPGGQIVPKKPAMWW
jgi:hypothetical protein